MLYAIISQDVPDSLALRQGVRENHLARLRQLADEQRLLVAGPFPNEQQEGFTGSLVIAEFDSIEAAQTWADADPYVAAGVYEQVQIKPYKKVLP